MSAHTLRREISCCRIGDDVVFLDISRDRYFRLPSGLERAFLRFMDGGQLEPQSLEALVQRGVLLPDPVSEQQRVWAEAPCPVCSAMEMPSPPVRVDLRTVADVLLTTLRARWDLCTKPLEAILSELGPIVEGPAKAPSHGADAPYLFDCAAQFRRARLYAPVAMRCLIDSIAMTRFLRRRGLSAQIVFGVALNPFSAHCWVQSGDVVLNDSIGNVNAHTVIRVV